MAEAWNPITPEQAERNRQADFARADARRALMAHRRQTEAQAEPLFDLRLVFGYGPRFSDEDIASATQLAYDYLAEQLPSTKVT